MNNPLELKDFVAFRLQKAEELLSGHISPEDFLPVKIALEKIADPTISNIALYDKYFKKEKAPSAKSGTIKAKVTKVINKYPEIFKPLRDVSIVNIKEILKSMNDIALNEDIKTVDRIRAGKAVIDTAVQVEKMSKDTEIKHLSLETVVMEGKSFKDIIKDARERISA